MKSEDKKQIANTYGVTYNYFESWIESIAYVRNLCVHYGRLYNAKLSKTPILYDEYSKLGIKNIRIFGVLICISHLVPHDQHWFNFVEKLEGYIRKYKSVKIYSMGFPNDWKVLLTEEHSDNR